MAGRNPRDDIFVGISEHGHCCVQRLEEIWELLYGKDESIFSDRYAAIKQHVNVLFDDMVKEEEESLETNRQILFDLMNTRITLQEELSMIIELPFETDATKPNICKQIQNVTAVLKKYEAIKMKRLQTLIEFKDTEERLCDLLGEEPRYASVSTVPSEELLAEIKTYLEYLDTEKVRRSKACHKLIDEIEVLVNGLELDYDATDGKLDLLDRSDSATFSNNRISSLEELKSELDSLKETRVAEIDVLREKITLLWNLLDISSAERDPVLQQTAKGFGQSVVDTLTRELERCEGLKVLNLQIIISKLRDVIKQLWDECHISEEERNDFIYFRYENYDESMLEAHEKEHRRLCDYKEERKNVLDLAKKWFTLWEKMIRMENQASSSTNRYANRGGQLLKEERERKAVQKELPKVETALQKLIAELEARTGAPFMYDGRPLLNVIAEMWEKRRIEKENEKESRKGRVTPLKPNHTAQTPASSLMKRGKVLGAVENMSARKPVTARRELKMPMSTKKEVRRRSRSHESKLRSQDDIMNRAQGLLEITDSTVGSYAGFQAFLEDACKNGKTLRSSTSPPSASAPTTPTSSGPFTSVENAFQFKSPKMVVKFKPKKFFLSPKCEEVITFGTCLDDFKTHFKEEKTARTPSTTSSNL